jgi:hypothetical protein
MTTLAKFPELDRNRSQTFLPWKISTPYNPIHNFIPLIIRTEPHTHKQTTSVDLNAAAFAGAGAGQQPTMPYEADAERRDDTPRGWEKF